MQSWFQLVAKGSEVLATNISIQEEVLIKGHLRFTYFYNSVLEGGHRVPEPLHNSKASLCTQLDGELRKNVSGQEESEGGREVATILQIQPYVLWGICQQLHLGCHSMTFTARGHEK